MRNGVESFVQLSKTSIKIYQCMDIKTSIMSLQKVIFTNLNNSQQILLSKLCVRLKRLSEEER